MHFPRFHTALDSRVCSVAASIGCSFSGTGFLFQNHYPRFTGAPSSFFKGCPQGRPSVDSGLQALYAEGLRGSETACSREESVVGRLFASQ